jgi:hypothetical protein
MVAGRYRRAIGQAPLGPKALRLRGSTDCFVTGAVWVAEAELPLFTDHSRRAIVCGMCGNARLRTDAPQLKPYANMLGRGLYESLFGTADRAIDCAQFPDTFGRTITARKGVSGHR